MLWHTADFKQPETCVLCRFCWDDIEETILLQPSPNALRAGMVPRWEQAKALCSRWGTHSCGSRAEAERIIQASLPEIWEQGKGTQIWIT